LHPANDEKPALGNMNAKLESGIELLHAKAAEKGWQLPFSDITLGVDHPIPLSMCKRATNGMPLSTALLDAVSGALVAQAEKLFLRNSLR
jgi:hypothetical protein